MRDEDRCLGIECSAREGIVNPITRVYRHIMEFLSTIIEVFYRVRDLHTEAWLGSVKASFATFFRVLNPVRYPRGLESLLL